MIVYKMEIINWIDLVNERKVNINNNKNIDYGLENTKIRLYGDAELNIKIIENYKGSMEEFIKYVKENSNGWIRTTKNENIRVYYKRLKDILLECGDGFDEIKEGNYCRVRKDIIKKFHGDIWNIWLPTGHSNIILNDCIKIRDDGNFKMYSGRIKNKFYLICFATS